MPLPPMSDPSPPWRRHTTARAILAPFAVLTIGSTLFVFLVAAPGNGFAARPRDAAALFGHLLVFHAVLVALLTAVSLPASALAARRGLGSLSGRIFGCGLGALVALNAILAFPVTYGPLNSREQPFVTPLGLWGLAVFVAAPFLLGAALGGRRRLGIAWTVAFAATLVALWIAVRPADVDLGDAKWPAAAESRGEHRGEPSVVLLGFDGLSWNVLLPLVERGELPAFAALAGRGARGALATDVPTLSPALWTTIATGRRPADHGTYAFSKFRLPGMTAPLVRGPVLSTPNWWNGLNRVLQRASYRGWVDNELFTGFDRRVPAIWDVADHYGLAAGMVGWLASWPVATPQSGGFRVSDLGPRSGSRFPPELAVDRPQAPPLPPGGDPFVARTWRETQEAVVATAALVERHAPRVTAAYFRFPDPVQHHAWRGERFLLGRGTPGLDRLPRELVASYRFFDELLARLLAKAPPGSVVVLVSDHGFVFDGDQHHHGPPGVLVMAGPGVRRAVIAGATIYDVFPTVLTLLGLPVTEEAPGRVLDEAFEPGRLPPRRTVATYDWYRPEAGRSGEPSPEWEQEELRRLRALGYVN